MRKLFFLSIIFFLFSFVLSPVSFAQESASPSPEITPTVTPTQVEYQLPYPGLLPDNKFYYLKTLRDRIVSFLISDPLKKAEFNLLQADKRLNAGIALFNKGKGDLAHATISKGENYFEKAISELKEARRQGMGTSDTARRLFLAAKKHQEVLSDLEKRSPDNLKESFAALKKRVVNFESKGLLRPAEARLR